MVSKRRCVRGLLFAPALAQWVYLSGLWRNQGLVDSSATDTLRGLSASELGNCRDDL